jgi:hypothetical protein
MGAITRLAGVKFPKTYGNIFLNPQILGLNNDAAKNGNY